MNGAHSNPLLDFSGLTRFDAIEPHHVTPALDMLLAEAREAVETVATQTSAATWRNVVEPLTRALDRLDRAWGAVRYLNAVVNTPELREAYNANLARVTALHTDLAQDLRLYRRYRALRGSAEFDSLDPARRKLIEN